MSTALFKALAKYKQADEFSHFSSQLSAETRLDLQRGKHLYQALGQAPEDLFSLVEQQLMLETIMIPDDDRQIDIAGLRKEVKEVAKKAKGEEDYDKLEAGLLEKFGAKKVEETKPTEEAPEDEAKQAVEAKK